MLTLKRLCIVAALLFACSGHVAGQGYPNKPIRVVTAEVGGGSDFVARLIAVPLTANIGQQVIVDDRGGNAGEIVARAAPDGYTLLVFSSAIWTLPFMRKNMPYDAVRDFAPITIASSAPNVLVVHPALPVRTVKDLIALAKSEPGKLNYGSGISGSISHIAPELFKSMAGVNIVRISYKGAGPALNALTGGQVQLMVPTAGAVTALIKANRLHALAITSARPSALLPELPTVAASGVPGYESVGLYCVFAPASTPVNLIDRLHAEIVKVLRQPDIREKFFNAGSDVVANSPAEFAAARKADMARIGNVIRDAAITED